MLPPNHDSRPFLESKRHSRELQEENGFLVTERRGQSLHCHRPDGEPAKAVKRLYYTGRLFLCAGRRAVEKQRLSCPYGYALARERSPRGTTFIHLARG